MAKTKMASETIESKNKALVLEVFDTLFNKRDYETAQRFWSPDYIQHSAHIEPGREGLFNLIKSLPPTLKYGPCLARHLANKAAVEKTLWTISRRKRFRQSSLKQKAFMRDAGTMVMFAGTPYAHLHICGSPWEGNEYHRGDRGVWTMRYERP